MTMGGTMVFKAILAALTFSILQGAQGRGQSAPASLLLSGEGAASKTLTLAELAALPQSEVAITGRDSSRVILRGPTVRSLMTLVGAPAGRELRGPNMLLVVVAEASDGYKVAYALAELDDQFNDVPVIVAISQNGGPLPAAEGPFRVAMGGGGEHRARWLRNLTRLRLVRIAP